ncbi:MAG: Arc-like binding domain [Bacteroidota bacterium]|jgi:hypothetical protein
MKENKTKFVTLRMTPALHNLIKSAANAEGRTVCAQINYFLAKSLGKTPSK